MLLLSSSSGCIRNKDILLHISQNTARESWFTSRKRKLVYICTCTNTVKTWTIFWFQRMTKTHFFFQQSFLKCTKDTKIKRWHILPFYKHVLLSRTVNHKHTTKNWASNLDPILPFRTGNELENKMIAKNVAGIVLNRQIIIPGLTGGQRENLHSRNLTLNLLHHRWLV